jgi:hypothetical protein
MKTESSRRGEEKKNGYNWVGGAQKGYDDWLEKDYGRNG